jgi:hypothetical protein
MKNTLLCIFIIITYINTLQAQTKIWGAGASNGVAAGEFQNAFVDTTSIGNYALNEWTALSVYDSDTIFPGNAYWTRSTLGYSQGAYWTVTTPFAAPSQSNGAAIFDSDYLDNNGVAGAFGTGMSPSGHKAELISPRIDLSGYTDSVLMVKFFSKYRDFEIDELSLSMSVDDGTTWSTAIDYRALQYELTEAFVRAYFPNFTMGVSNLSNCRLKFTFEGYYYFALLDDVSIEVAPDYDLAIARPDTSSTVLEEKGDYIKIGNNRYLACINLLAYDIQQWYFGLRAVNHGAKDILPSDSARVRLQIDFADRFGNTATNIYNDAILITDTLFSSAQNSIFAFDNLDDINFIFIHGDGDYIAKYWVEHDQMDAYGDNDTIRHTFSNTEYNPLYNYMSKARISFDDKVFASTAIFPAETDLISYEYGSMYYFPRGNSDGIKIDSVDFRYFVPYGYTGDTTIPIIVNIHQFRDNNPADGLLNSVNELTTVGIGVKYITGVGTTTAPGTYGFARFSSILHAATSGPMDPFFDNGYYMVSIQQAPYLLGNNVLLDSSKCVWFGVDEYNYAQNMALTAPNNTMPHSFITMARASQYSTISWEENRLNMVPSIGIHLSGNFLAHGIDPVSASESTNLAIYPNPAQDFVMVQVDFKTTEAIQYILTDVAGQIIQMQNQKDASSLQRFNLKKLPAGTYFIIARNKTEETSTTFVKK